MHIRIHTYQSAGVVAVDAMQRWDFVQGQIHSAKLRMASSQSHAPIRAATAKGSELPDRDRLGVRKGTR